MKKTLYLKFILAYIIFGFFGFMVVATFVSSMTMEHLKREKADALYKEATLIANTYASDLYNNETTLESVKNHYGPADTNSPQIELSLPASTGLIRYLELREEKSAVNARIKEIESEMKRLQGRIVAEMGRTCEAACSVGGSNYIVTYKPTRKPDISKDNLFRLQAQHPDIYNDYVTVSESRRFYVKKSQEDNAA